MTECITSPHENDPFAKFCLPSIKSFVPCIINATIFSAVNKDFRQTVTVLFHNLHGSI